MNNNVGISSNGVIEFAAGVSSAVPHSLKNWTRFGWVIEAIADVAADVVIKVQFAPPSVADPCIPGAYVDAVATAICSTPAVGALAQFTIPAGTKAGSNCAVTIPCRGGEFVRLVGVSGPIASLNAVLVRTGPTV